MLKSILTTNFKKLSSNFFTFTDGLNIICGDNFKGKTTLTQAIAFALFGVKAIPGSAKKIPTWGQKDCLVDLNIGDYQIVRTLKNCTVHKDSAPVATGVETCNDYIEKNITGVDYKGFQILNWSAQGETAALLTMGAAQLQRDVEKFSGVAFIDEMIKLASVDLRDATRETKLYEPRGTEEDIKRKISGSEKGIAGFRAEVGEANKTIRGCKAEREVIEKEIEDAERVNRKHSTNLISINTLTVRLEEAAENIKTLEETKVESEEKVAVAGGLTREGYELRKHELEWIRKINNTVMDKKQELSKIEAAFPTIDNYIKADNKLVEALKAAEEAQEVCREAHHEAIKHCGVVNVVIQELQEVIDSGVCKTCGQNISSPEQIKEHEKDLTKSNKAKVKLERVREAAAEALSDAETRTVKATTDYDQGFGNWGQNKLHSKKGIVELKQYLKANQYDENLGDNLFKLDKSLEALALVENEQGTLTKVISRLAYYRENQSDWQEELEEIERDTSEPVSQDVIDLRKAELKERVDKQNEALDSLHQAEKNEALFAAELKELRLDLEAELKFRDQMVEVKSLTDFTDFLKESRVKFLSTIWSGILSVASDFLLHTTDGNITAVTKSEKEGFLFCEDGVYAPVESASGAQRAFIGVGVRLALAKCLRSACELVVLDEPTESMREDNALRLSGGLLGRGQVIMVTHRESDKLSASNIIEL